MSGRAGHGAVQDGLRRVDKEAGYPSFNDKKASDPPVKDKKAGDPSSNAILSPRWKGLDERRVNPVVSSRVVRFPGEWLNNSLFSGLGILHTSLRTRPRALCWRGMSNCTVITLNTGIISIHVIIAALTHHHPRTG